FVNQASSVTVPAPHNTAACTACHTASDYIPNAPIANAKCNTCHGIGTTGGSTLKVERHFSDNYIDPTTGQLADIKCVECHNPMSAQSNLKLIRSTIRSSAVVFTAYTGANSFADNVAPYDGICEVCHTNTNHHQNDGIAPGGQSHNDGTDCRTCHTHSAGFIPTATPADAPHNAITNCNYCHVDAQPYTTVIPDSKCEQCHTAAGALKAGYPTAPNVLSHTAANGSGRYNYTNSCVACHDVMHAQGNQKHVRGTLAGSVIAGSSIGFTSYTGAGSFADGIPFNENVCQTCHTQTNHQWYNGGAPLDNRNGYTPHHDSENCTACHAHGSAFLPTLTPPPFPHDTASCSACHTVDALGRMQDAYANAPIANSKCEACHGIGSVGGSTLKVDRHFSDNYLDPTTGLLADIKCVECHNPMSTQINFRFNNNLKFIRSVIRGSNIAFEAQTGQYSYASDNNMPADMTAANYICNTCHTATNHHQNDGIAPGGQSHNDGADCRTCHAHNAGFQHNVTTPVPHNVQACTTCHTTPDTYVPNAAIPNTACLTCHDPAAPGTGAGGSDLKVDTHFSTTYTDPTTGVMMNLNCVECHNPMSTQTNFRGNTNLKFVRSAIRGNNVAFEAQTGQYSYASDNNKPADMTTANYLCNTCHTQTNHHQADGVAPGGQSHNDGAKCTSCHFHDAGFQPSGNCLQCHNSTPPAGSSDTRRRQIVESTPGTGDFVKTSHHVLGATASSQIVNQDACIVCHDQTNHTTYGDGVSAYLKNQDTGAGIIYNGTGSSAEAFCVSCHDANGSTLYGATPFNQAGSGDTHSPVNIGWTIGTVAHSGAANTNKCLACHGDTAGINAHGSSLAKLLRYTYNVNDTVTAATNFCYNCHGNTPANGAVDAIKSAFDLTTGRHSTVKCLDCHDQHTAVTGNHANGTTLAGVLTGSIGRPVSVAGANWVAPTYGAAATITAEYQLCYKCHSTGQSAVGLGTGAAQMTDLGLEFNTGNTARHPIGTALATGSRLIAAQLAGGRCSLPQNTTSATCTSAGGTWTAWAPGAIMTCTDCHDSSLTNQSGPHGSSVKWMLKGPNQAWPYTASTSNGTSGTTGFRTLSNKATSSGTANGLFCLNCHPSANTANNVHSQGNHSSAACVNCHIRVPHGGKMPRFVNANNTNGTGTGLPARYWPAGNGTGTIYLEAFVKAATPTGYSSSSTNCNVTCDTRHNLTISTTNRW
ncbi:MAG: cytochrome c3 family protein, partial [Nitrospirae bacterium]|nr:cytochrome c3 family protein [Nitrospirota bacterium]